MLRLHSSTELMLSFASYNYVCWGARSSPSQMPTVLLTTALIVWLDYHLTDGISNLDGLLEVTVTPLRVPLTIERSTRFILWSNTSKLLNTTWLQGQVSVVIPKLGTTLPPTIPNWQWSPLKPRAQLYMEVVTDCDDQQPRIDLWWDKRLSKVQDRWCSDVISSSSVSI